MLKPAVMLLAALYAATPTTCLIYEKSNRTAALCEQTDTLTGIYTNKDYSEAELGQLAAKQDIYITYLTQGDKFPADFMALCSINDKLPLIILRPTDYSTDYVNTLASRLASYNMPVLLQIDSSRSAKYKDFFRTSADIIHLKAPSVAIVWGISSDKADEITTLYPGDSYVDWVALNIFEGADKNGIITEPYPLYHTISYFEKSKPIIINLSVASYTYDGHKYFINEAAAEITRIYALSSENSSVKAVNYISKATTKGNAELTNSQRLADALKKAAENCGHCENIRIPVIAYKHGSSLYCENGIIPTTEEYCIAEGRTLYKIENAGRYIFEKT